MKFTKLVLGILLVVPLVMFIAGCGGGGGGGTPPVPIIVSITVTPVNATVATGTTTQFSATATYSNGLRLDLTSTANWTSSAPGVATVSNAGGSKGQVTAVAAGTTTITATVAGISGSTTLTVSSGSFSGANVMTVTVNGSLCSDATSAGYINKPCVSVTICNPGSTTACQTINDILVDTGSYGLRIFKSAIPGLSLTQLNSGSGGALAECIQFADGSSLWGPVQLANVQLGSEPAVQLPIQVIDASFGARPAQCANADVTPVNAGLTGILGVGVANEDCGPACETDRTIGIYYTCSGSGCTGTTVPVSNQVQNPVSHLPQDNNGLLFQLPAVPPIGAGSVTGSMILGIGTQPNNIPSPVPTVFPTTINGEFNTVYNGTLFNQSNGGAFLDSGSNAYFIPNINPTVLPLCAGSADWYCPPTFTTVVPRNIGITGAPTLDTPISVGNFVFLFSTGNRVFNDIAGTSTFGFDFGLPFFLGRNVYVGFDGKTSPTLGTGPFVAY
jgi:hypothetical protein